MEREQAVIKLAENIAGNYHEKMENSHRQFLTPLPQEAIQYWDECLSLYDGTRKDALEFYGNNRDFDEYRNSVEHTVGRKFSVMATSRERHVDPEILLSELEVDTMLEVQQTVGKLQLGDERHEEIETVMREVLVESFKKTRKDKLRQERKGIRGKLGRLFRV